MIVTSAQREIHLQHPELTPVQSTQLVQHVCTGYVSCRGTATACGTQEQQHCAAASNNLCACHNLCACLDARQQRMLLNHHLGVLLLHAGHLDCRQQILQAHFDHSLGLVAAQTGEVLPTKHTRE